MENSNRIDMKTGSKKYILLPLVFIILIDAMSVGIVWPLISVLFLDPNTAIVSNQYSLFYRDLLYGIAIAISPICTIFGSSFLGDLSDYIGRKKVLTLCLYGTFLGYMFCYFSLIFKTVLLFIIGRALIGFFVGSQATAQSVILDVSSERKGENLSLITITNNFGFILGPLLGGLLVNNNLVSWFDVKTPFAVSAVLAFCNALLISFIFKETYTIPPIKSITFSKKIKDLFLGFKEEGIQPLLKKYLFAQLGLSFYLQYSILNLVQFHHYTGIKMSYFLITYFCVSSFSLLLILPQMLFFISIEKLASFAAFVAFLGFSLSTFNVEFILWMNMIIAVGAAAITYNCLLTLLSNATNKTSQGRVMGMAGSIQALCFSFGALSSSLLGSFHSSLPFLLAGGFVLYSLLININSAHETAMR